MKGFIVNKDDFKKKLSDVKSKIKENAPTIIATVSTGAAFAVTALLIANKAKHVEELAGAVRRIDAMTGGKPFLFLGKEVREEMMKDGGAVVFNFDGDNDFCVMYCTDEHSSGDHTL